MNIPSEQRGVIIYMKLLEDYLDKKWRARVEAERMIKLMNQLGKHADSEFKNSITMSCAKKLIRDIGNREFDEYDAVFEPAEDALVALKKVNPVSN